MIGSLQILRAVCFIGVFLSHCKFSCLNAAGAWAVSVFFVLSGFLLVLKYDSNVQLNEGGMRFAYRHIRKIYLLHVIMALLALGLVTWKPHGGGGAVIINLLLIQSWLPWGQYYASLNWVSWFLSSLMFCYFIFPYVRKYLLGIKLMRDVVMWFVIVVLIMIILIAMASFFGKSQIGLRFGCCQGWGWPHWFTYFFPLFRAGDFLCGCLLGCFFNISRKRSNPIATGGMWGLVFIMLFSTFVSQWLCLTYDAEWFDWFRWTLIFIPSSCLCVYLTACVNYVSSERMMLKWMIGLGSMSGYAYLIHRLVILFMTRSLGYMSESAALKAPMWDRLCIAAFAFVFTLLLTLLYVKLDKMVYKK